MKKNKKGKIETDSKKEFIKELKRRKKSLPPRIDANPENVEKGLAQLVLTLVELIRKLMEKQAMRRIEGGLLRDEEVERIGQTLMKLEEKMKGLKKNFNLKDEDLDIDLGPLGHLIGE